MLDDALDRRRPRRVPRRWLAVLLAVVGVGAGHVYVGRLQRALAFYLAALGGLLTATALFVVAPNAPTCVAFLASLLAFALLRYILAVDLLVMPRERMLASPWWHAALAAVLFVAATTGTAVVTRARLIEAFKIPGGSMMPTLIPGDHVFVNKLAFRIRPPERGELAVFAFPEHPEQDFVKRVIAIEGDKLEVKNGHPWINGWEVPHCAVGSGAMSDGETTFEGDYFVEFLGRHAYLTFYDRKTAGFDEYQGPYGVRRGEHWVLGDNRNNSHDSRMWFGGVGGGVSREAMRGPPVLIWLSTDERHGLDWSRQFMRVDRPVSPPSLENPVTAARLAKCLSEVPAETLPPLPDR